MAFTLLLGLLVALPSFGIDMSLPALTSMGGALGVAPERAGLMMSLFMLGFAVAPLFYGPVSDRYGRKPVVVFACTLFAIAGIGCAFARSLPTLLAWRVVQGAGAGASMTIALAIVRDLFEGQAARTKLSLGYEPVGFIGPQEAAQACAERARFDAALLCHQPGASFALDFATTLRELSPNLPIVLATTSARDLDAQLLATSGVSEVVHHPLTSSELAGALSRCLATSVGPRLQS
jgi:CheY-like chemotaxis protein